MTQAQAQAPLPPPPVPVPSAASALTNPADEWICPFCEYELFYGDDAGYHRAVRNRKKILRRRRRARERAAAAASGVGSGTGAGASVDAKTAPANPNAHANAGSHVEGDVAASGPPATAMTTTAPLKDASPARVGTGASKQGRERGGARVS